VVNEIHQAEVTTMRKAKHTPGPWRYGLGYRVRPDRGLDAQGREIGGPTIAELNADADRCCPLPAEIEANGRLIAAAPDLLAALEHLASAASSPDLFGPIHPVGSHKDRLRQAIEHAREAIAKVTG
jgi:hypothetical protein